MCKPLFVTAYGSLSMDNNSQVDTNDAQQAEAVVSELCMLEAMRCMLLCMSEAVGCRLCCWRC